MNTHWRNTSISASHAEGISSYKIEEKFGERENSFTFMIRNEIYLIMCWSSFSHNPFSCVTIPYASTRRRVLYDAVPAMYIRCKQWSGDVVRVLDVRGIWEEGIAYCSFKVVYK